MSGLAPAEGLRELAAGWARWPMRLGPGNRRMLGAWVVMTMAGGRLNPTEPRARRDDGASGVASRGK
jgi:hypothetical protein